MQLIARLFWPKIPFDHMFAHSRKAGLTTCLPTDRKNFQLHDFRAIMDDNQISGCSEGGIALDLGEYVQPDKKLNNRV